MERNILLVGERFNIERRWPHHEEAITRGDQSDIRHWLEYSLRCSCFKRDCGPAKRRLVGIGLDPVHSSCLNLLPPASCSEWCAETAERVAESMLDWLFTRDIAGPFCSRVVLLGKRVARAVCGRDVELLSTHVVEHEDGFKMPMIVVPHPSGLNHWWNVAENWELGREAVEEFLS